MRGLASVGLLAVLGCPAVREVTAERCDALKKLLGVAQLHELQVWAAVAAALLSASPCLSMSACSVVSTFWGGRMWLVIMRTRTGLGVGWSCQLGLILHQVITASWGLSCTS